MPRLTPAVDRFFAKVEKTDTCWLWTGTKVNGYGRFKDRTHVGTYVSTSAHRWSYEHHIGPIPAGLNLDHLCRVPACVNPAHLEPVTQFVNCARIPRPSHCGAGHEYTPENTLVREGINRYQRRCRACDAIRARRRRELAGSQAISA